MHNQICHNLRYRLGLMMLIPVCLMQSGCFLRQFMKPSNPFAAAPPCVFLPDAGKEEIVAHLNANTSRLTAWRSTRVRIHLKQKGSIPVDLNAQIAVESPKSFRMRASSLLGEEADFGSNPERFWFWIKRSPQPYVMTAAHEDMGLAQQQLPIPFEPEWVMEAFGVVMLDPAQFQLERINSQRINLTSHETSAAGQQVIKSIGVDLCSGRIVEHALFDDQGTLIARANLGNHTTSSEGISLPHQVVLDWPQAGTTMRMSLLDVEINPAFTPQTMWQMPTEIAPVVNLGR